MKAAAVLKAQETPVVRIAIIKVVVRELRLSKDRIVAILRIVINLAAPGLIATTVAILLQAIAAVTVAVVVTRLPALVAVTPATIVLPVLHVAQALRVVPLLALHAAVVVAAVHPAPVALQALAALAADVSQIDKNENFEYHEKAKSLNSGSLLWITYCSNSRRRRTLSTEKFTWHPSLHCNGGCFYRPWQRFQCL